MYSSMITPVCTETPNKARKPTPEDTLKFVCVTSRATNPPSRAIATFVRIRNAHFIDRNIVYRITKTHKLVAGSTTNNRRSERFWLSYSPPQQIVYPDGNFTPALT